MAFGKWVKRKSSQATKAAGKRYGMSYGRRGFKMSKNSLSKVAKDVMMIKAQLNVEKKYKDTLVEEDGLVGQVNVNVDGASHFEITPSLTQGVGESERVGNSIKATGAVLKFSMLKQNQAEGDRRLKIFIVRSLDPDIAAGTVHTRLLDINPFVPVRDYNSNMDYTNLKDARLRVIAQKNVYFPQNGGDGMNLPGENGTKSISIPIKLNDVLRYRTNNSTEPENVRYFCVIVCDNGNSGATTSSVLGCLVPQSESGIIYKCHSRFWYVDN